MNQVGPGYAIAAALYCRDNYPEKRVICVEGDSAFGFSGMEVETMYRYKLPIIIIIINNGGIYGGLDEDTYEGVRSDGDLTQTYVQILWPTDFFFLCQFLMFDIFRIPPTALTFETRYEAMMGMFGESGFFVRTIPELRRSLNDALSIKDRPSIINVIIGPTCATIE